MEIIYLETNIILDFLDENRQGSKTAQKILEIIYRKNYTIAISEDMLSTIYYISKDKNRALEFFEFIIKSEWQIVGFGVAIVQEAINFSKSSNLDFEDILQCLTAKRERAKYLITNDKKFIDCGVDTLSGKEFIEKMRE
jgi:predicted nucleic acid-binding protein